MEDDWLMVLNEEHNSVVGGHYAGKATMHTNLYEGLWWHTLPIDAREYCHIYDVFQRTRILSWRYEMPRVPHVNLHAFDKWLFDFVGPTNPQGKCTSACYIIARFLTLW